MRRPANAISPGLRGLSTCLVLIAAGLVGGCGVGPGAAAEGEANLTVTRDFGREVMLDGPVTELRESTTVLGALDLAADVETRFGGGFVQSIDGVEGGAAGERLHDWFFYVNGVESEVGAAQAAVEPGDRIWWDERTWSGAMRVPAVVGSFPQPLVSETPVRFDCHAAEALCNLAADKLATAGIESSPVGGDPGSPAGEAPRILIGAWPDIAGDPAAELLGAGPQGSGVFARFIGGRVELLDSEAEAKTALVAKTGIVAAVRVGEERPVWIVTGTDETGLEAAVAALDRGSLADRYAVVAWHEGGSPDDLQVHELPIADPRPGAGTWSD